MIRSTLTLAALAVALAAPGNAAASGGNYRFDGGTAKQQGQVRSALNASSFDWNVVPAQITIHIGQGSDSEAAYGEIWLDADLLNSGVFSWGTVQHEYAHQVDFFLLTPERRAWLSTLFGHKPWGPVDQPGLAHANYASERFASTLSWSFWQSSANAYRPSSAADEAGGVDPGLFRAVVRGLMLQPAAPAGKRAFGRATELS